MKTLRWLALSLIGVVMVTQFTNCGNYAEPAVYSSASAITTCDDDCITESVDDLSIKANTGTTAEYGVTVDIGEFNLGGDCNEGGFPINVVRWELYQVGRAAAVRTSDMLGTGGTGTQANTLCANGRFQLYVFLGSITEDPVNRQGLGIAGGGRGAHELWIEIRARTPAGTDQINNLSGRSRISLIPL